MEGKASRRRRTVRPVNDLHDSAQDALHLLRPQRRTISSTRQEVVRRLRSGEAVLMDEEPEVPFFERIMGSVISKMKQ
jgi:hypothetical protein